MIAYQKSRVGQRVNHKGLWLFLTGFYNNGYWQAQDHGQSLTWVKTAFIPVNPDYRGTI